MLSWFDLLTIKQKIEHASIRKRKEIYFEGSRSHISAERSLYAILQVLATGEPLRVPNSKSKILASKGGGFFGFIS